MKRIAITLGVILAVSSHNNAQNVGINPTGNLPNNSAGLDVDFTNKGVLIPRVALTARNSNAPIGAGIANSLLVYNTATAGTFPNNVYPGYYYWDGSAWQRLTNGIANGWDINGNTLTGTLPATPNEFIGTVNAADWIIKTNNTERMRIKSNGQVVINNTTPFAGDVFSSYAAGTDAAINGYSSGSGEAVYGQNTGTGLSIVGLITNNNPAVYGQGPNIGTEGVASANNGTGLLGVGPSSVTADGVNGIAGNNQAQGGVFYNTNATGTGLLVGGNSVATMSILTNGSGIAATSTTFGIVSYGIDATQGNGIAASGNNLGIINFGSGSGGTFYGQTIGVYGIANSSANDTWGGYFSNAASGAGASYAYVGGKTSAGTNRKIEGNGTVNTIVKDLKGNLVTLTCPEAPEILFEDYGVGQLINGKAHIDLDPIFAKNVTINEKHPLRVFIQLEGECNGVYVTNKTSTGFDVVELNGGKSNVKFVYHVVANRSDDIDENGNVLSRYADIRFGPGMPPMKPTFVESKTKEAPKIKIPDITPKKVSSK
ncbi:MAG: hypothetical protein N3F62_08040 [Bacteroidia bacterium]|nr:hypothetical protein [Bacteroidia bacterium]